MRLFVAVTPFFLSLSLAEFPHSLTPVASIESGKYDWHASC